MMSQSTVLQAALAYILRNEGGFIDNPDDRGGPTNFGITMPDLAAWRKKAVTADDVKYMTANEAENIYWEHYLKPIGCDQLKSKPLALCLADSAVLYGPGTSIHYAQTVCNGYGYNLNVDGLVGPSTIAALNSVNPLLFIKDFHALLMTRINTICADDPTQEKFRKGWTARADRLLLLS